MVAHRLVVVGGGIAGTAAAFGASRLLASAGRAEIEVLLVEEGAALGGKARSLAREGFLFEAGPNGYLDAEGELDGLIAAAGLAKLPAEAAAARRYLVQKGRLREIRPHPVAFAASGILSVPALLRLAAEPWVPRRAAGGDESAFDFASRRLGRQVAERLVQPMVQGIYAGDARALSLAAAFPRLAALEREHGSLLRGLRARRREARAALAQEAAGAPRGRAPLGGPAGPAGALTSFAGGLQALPLGLAAAGGFGARTGARAVALDHDDARRVWRVAIEGDAQPLTADAVLLAVPAHAAATLLADLMPRAADELARIDHPPVAVVGLGYGPGDVQGIPAGFGALVPRGEGARVIGVLLESQIFAGRAPRGGLLVRAMLGGALEREVGELGSEALIATARADLERLFGLRARPVFEEVVLWPRAIPQYGLGHLERLARIEAAREELSRARPGLFLAGNWSGGVAFTRAAQGGLAAGEAAARDLLERAALRSS